MGLASLPSQVYEDVVADDTVPVLTNEIVKGARVTFKESAHVLQRIVEFMYLGEIGDLEKGNSTASEDDYNLWMWLLTWCASDTILWWRMSDMAASVVLRQLLSQTSNSVLSSQMLQEFQAQGLRSVPVHP